MLALWKRAQAIPGTTDTVEALTRVMREQGELFLVAVQNRRIVGSVIAGWDGWRGTIYRLAVDPDVRRRGVGRALIDEAERRLIARNVPRMSVLVAHDDPRAVAFWDAMAAFGYERDPQMIRYVKMLPSRQGGRGGRRTSARPAARPGGARRPRRRP